ncbi:hypothetical protein PHMEG_00029853 [Phytophthora megakarya]|uniref:Uncharacterized protein n=1 Tax=Phytophthora megakarya TaxID=4795 RepID=A0A225V274_9STRA|nr:hypothetical protein PHMEG_00029853 [Phytophthora megakarya]
MKTSYRKHEEVVRLLLDNKAAVDLTDNIASLNRSHTMKDVFAQFQSNQFGAPEGKTVTAIPFCRLQPVWFISS